MGRFTSHNLLEHWGARAPQTPPVNSSGNIIVFQMGRFTSHNLLEHWGARAPQIPPVYSSGNIQTPSKQVDMVSVSLFTSAGGCACLVAAERWHSLDSKGC